MNISSIHTPLTTSPTAPISAVGDESKKRQQDQPLPHGRAFVRDEEPDDLDLEIPADEPENASEGHIDIAI